MVGEALTPTISHALDASAMNLPKVDPDDLKKAVEADPVIAKIRLKIERRRQKEHERADKVKELIKRENAVLKAMWEELAPMQEKVIKKRASIERLYKGTHVRTGWVRRFKADLRKRAKKIKKEMHQKILRKEFKRELQLAVPFDYDEIIADPKPAGHDPGENPATTPVAQDDPVAEKPVA